MSARILPVLALTLALFGISPMVPAGAAPSGPQHGISMHGDLKYPPDFTHFNYVNPQAPKGGTLKQAVLGDSFDTLNPYTLKGNAAANLGLMYDTLMAQAADEPFSEYGLVAKTVEIPADRSWVIFTLRPEARWHDGKPVTAEDVLFSFETLRDKGHPQYGLYYQSVDKAEVLGPHKIKFTFAPGDNRELPLILGQLPILPKHYWQDKEFDQTTLTPPLSSGPYRIAKFEPGRYITYERVPDYWGNDLPVRKGQNNFDRLTHDYYRDSTVALEALKAGEYDLRFENEAKKWATGYKDWAAVKDGRAALLAFPNHRTTGMQGFVMNLRRPLFQDPRVRKALSLAFDFEWTNANLFYGSYRRTESFFANSDLTATGLPSKDELAILEPLRGKIPDEVFTKEYHAPKTDGSGNLRDNLREAMALLEQAGWHVDKNGLLMKDGKPFKFEILIYGPVWERVALPFVRNLKRLGITATVRMVDTAQYKNRTDDFDYDMVVDLWGQSSSPGNEQRSFWGSQAADQPGTRNSVGIKDPAIDQLIELVISAPDRASLVHRVHALDRVLLWNDFVIPHWHSPDDRYALWDRFGRPEIVPDQGVDIMTWWIDPAKDAKTGLKRGQP